MRDKANRTAYRIGFTLLELLAVVATVTIIVAILVPVFSTIRERGRRTTCQSNLKQLAMAMQQYVQDNNGTYPLSLYWQDAAYAYTKNVQVFRCPDNSENNGNATFTDPSGITSYYPVDYGYDLVRLNVFPPPFPPQDYVGAQEANLAAPSTTELNMDAGWTSPDGQLEQCREVPTTSCGRAYVGSTLHTGGGNYSYIDGHVKWRTPEEAGESECLNGPLPPPFKLEF